MGNGDLDDNNVGKFKEILMAEESYVDLTQLRELSRGGIPNTVRSQVWKLLLGIMPTSEGKGEMNGQELKLYQKLEFFAPSLKLVALHLNEYIKRNPSLSEILIDAGIDQIVCTYLYSRPNIEYRPGLVHMLCVCASTLKTKADIAAVFSRIVDLSGGTIQSIGKRMSSFLALLRRFRPSLANLFDNEAISPNTWALQWLQNLFAGSLPLGCTLRAWDAYLCEDKGWELHKYVCLAVLEMCEEDLQGLDKEELCGFLRHMPTLDMDIAISRAKNIRNLDVAPGISQQVRKAIARQQGKEEKQRRRNYQHHGQGQRNLEQPALVQRLSNTSSAATLPASSPRMLLVDSKMS